VSAAVTLPLDRESIVRAVRAGVSFDFLCFYGHKPSDDGQLTDACFSQWWDSPFDLDGVTYDTAEHWMMASKATLFRDEEMLAQILVAPSPAAAKKLGRAVRNFDGALWGRHRFDLVTKGNVAKFSSTPELKRHLLDTGDAILVEAAARDTIWGVGLGASNPAARDPTRWRGSNLLGFALVRARHVLRGELPAP